MSTTSGAPCVCGRYHEAGLPCRRMEYLATDHHEACRAEIIRLTALLTEAREAAVALEQADDALTKMRRNWENDVLYYKAHLTNVEAALTQAETQRDEAAADD